MYVNKCKKKPKQTNKKKSVCRENGITGKMNSSKIAIFFVCAWDGVGVSAWGQCKLHIDLYYYLVLM